jgi:hypothetical protein
MPQDFDEVLGSLCEYVESIRPQVFNQETETYQQANIIPNTNINFRTNMYQRNSNIKAIEISDFKMIKKLGQGTFGKVHLSQMISTGEYFAIKVLRKDKIL